MGDCSPPRAPSKLMVETPRAVKVYSNMQLNTENACLKSRKGAPHQSLGRNDHPRANEEDEEEDIVHTPLCTNAIVFPPLASRPVRAVHACSRAKGILMALAPHLTPQGQIPGGLVNPPKFRTGGVVRHGSLAVSRESPLTREGESPQTRPEET